MTALCKHFSGICGTGTSIAAGQVAEVRRVTQRPSGDEKGVAQQIVSYFLRNPETADTLEGIARWRLLDERIHESVRMTERALRSLVRKGLLVETAAATGTLYRLNETKRGTAEEFISRKTSPRKKPGSAQAGRRRPRKA
jgi:hypothetical protein